jgi:hypothetical protein
MDMMGLRTASGFTLVLALASAGCVSTEGGVGFGMPESGDTGGPGSGDGTATGDSSAPQTSGGDDGGTGDGDEPDDDDGMLFDVGAGEGTSTGNGGDDSDDYCPVDFLFVIDNSNSMLEEQENLVNSFPGFADLVADALGYADFHVLVTDTDPKWNQCRHWLDSFGVDGCQYYGNICMFDGVDACVATPTECEDQIGAGINFPTAHVPTSGRPVNRSCQLAGDRRYISTDTTDLAADFECIGFLGRAGTNAEIVLDELKGAIDLSAPGGCNEGFLRDEAILVVVIVSDEADHNSVATWEEVHETLLNAKHGQEKGVVILGLTSNRPVCGVENNDASAPRIESLVSSFPYHRIAPVCTPDYSVELAALLADIELSCEEYIPPEG